MLSKHFSKKDLAYFVDFVDFVLNLTLRSFPKSQGRAMCRMPGIATRARERPLESADNAW
jgi:hypothetical protein